MRYCPFSFVGDDGLVRNESFFFFVLFEFAVFGYYWTAWIEETFREGDELVGCCDEEISGCDSVASCSCSEGCNWMVEEICLCDDSRIFIIECTPFRPSLAWLYIQLTC